MKPAVVFPDIELGVVDYLTGLLEDVTVGSVLPTGWTPADGSFLLVACDAAFVTYPILNRATVRLTALGAGRTAMKALASQAQMLMLTHPGGPPIGSVIPGTGVIPGTDPDSGADLATCSVIAGQPPTA